MSLRKLSSVALALVVLPYGLVSCGGDSSSGPETFSVTVSPGTAEVATGSNTTLTARVTDASGATVPGQSFTWSSSNDAVATVSATGTVAGLTPGQVTITATTNINGVDQSATAIITVIQVATTVNVTPATGSIVVGATLQFAAEVLDGVGAPIAGATVTWSSSDPTVVSVDANGLATGVAEGMATISATVGPASGTASTEVLPAIGPLEPTADITLSGIVNVTTFTVPVGVTITVDADLVLNATETMNIAGTIAGTCVGVSLQAVGLITVNGSITTPCTGMAMPPGISILSGSGFTLEDAVITTSGPVSLVSDISADATPVFGAVASASVAAPCFINRTFIELRFPADDGDDGQPDGEDAYDGNDIEVRCGRDRAVLSSSTLMAQDGGNGGEGFTSDKAKTAQGGHGGHGGGVFITSAVGITFTGGSTSLTAGSGGKGGPGEASTDGDAAAIGGDGGNAGDLLVDLAAAGGEIFVEDLRLISLHAGTGGDGGSAFVSAKDGEDATDTEPAENGGAATATGGKGGDNFPAANKAVLGDLIPRGLVAGLLSAEIFGGGSGTGGEASGTAGVGGDGNMMFPTGGEGGALTVTGGSGGKLMILRNGNEDTYPGTPGNGGLAQFWTSEGGRGFNDCLVGDIKPGGNGGKAGDASGGDGSPGRGFDGSNQGTANGVDIISGTGVGGYGGDGVMPGDGGLAGADGIVVNGARRAESAIFEDGPDGDPCDKVLDSSISLTSDPYGHEMYLGLLSAAAGNLTLKQLPNGAVEIMGSPPWVNLTGTIIFVAALDAWEIRVTGDAPLNPPPGGGASAHYNFTGTATLDANGRATGFTGTLRVESTGLIGPANSPTTYSLTATMPMPSG